MSDCIDDIIKFPYKLDTFQDKSIKCIRKGNNVLVTAHTSAGKSTVAEYAIAHARYLGKEFYTQVLSRHFQIKNIMIFKKNLEIMLEL